MNKQREAIIMKTMVVVGAGKLLGLSLAKKFGKNGYHVILISRNPAKLALLQSELNKDNIQSSYFTADMYDLNSLKTSFSEIYQKFGQVDIMEFSPNLGHQKPINVKDLRPENLASSLQGNLLAAIQSVQEVLPGMLRRKKGALLFTTGLSAIYPNSNMADASVAKAALRNYILNLEQSLKDKNIFVGHLSLGVFLKERTRKANDPDIVADRWYQKYVNNEHGEEVYPKGVTQATVIR